MKSTNLEFLKSALQIKLAEVALLRKQIADAQAKPIATTKKPAKEVAKKTAKKPTTSKPARKGGKTK